MHRPPSTAYTTRELTRSTWKDFEALFSRYGGVQDGCWCMYYHRIKPNRGQPDAQRHAENRNDHRDLVYRDAAHGILVYAEGRPIGWCQYGRAPELPRVDAGLKYRALGPVREPFPTWRITCFFVDKGHRRSGVAIAALSEALAAIQRQGGGIVEAYPSTNAHAVAIWFGTESMFSHQGFERVAPFGRSNVLMRKKLAPKE